MESLFPLPGMRALRPLILLAVFMLVWSGRGTLDAIASAASAAAAQLQAQCSVDA
ncbi:hypothetical protein [Arenimonas sp. MALMAid1274]|uniref:hypothetical protein n=1 Tax=Arenimonas sp. MALMAid1274 TaxID=3411630 RepID=UPI003BA28304